MPLPRRFALAAALGLTSALAACASSGSSASSSSSGASATTRSNRALITAEELATASQTNIGDYIRAFRPRWLQNATRGASSMNGGSTMNASAFGVTVFIGNQNAGGLDQLQSIAPSAVSEIRYYEATEAKQRFNIRDISTVIQVVLKS